MKCPYKNDEGVCGINRSLCSDEKERKCNDDYEKRLAKSDAMWLLGDALDPR